MPCASSPAGCGSEPRRCLRGARRPRRGGAGPEERAVASGRLGSIDTFRFEERALLALVRRAHRAASSRGPRVVTSASTASGSTATSRGRRSGRPPAHGGARPARDLGPKAASPMTDRETRLARRVHRARRVVPLDQAQRRLEAWVANLDEEPEERPLGVVRRAYEDACHAMADGFTKALVKAGGRARRPAPDAGLQRGRRRQPKPVAYFLVDAMRFEMGVELAERLPKTAEVACARRRRAAQHHADRHGGADARCLGELQRRRTGGKLGARIDDAFLPDLAARKKHAAARVPKLVDLALDELLSLLSRRSSPRRSRARRSSSFARRRSTTPARRVHVPGAPGDGHGHRQPRAGGRQARRERASSTRWSAPTTATCSSPTTATSRCAPTRPAATRSSCIGGAGSGAAGPRRRAACGCRRASSATPRTSSSCSRPARASSRPAGPRLPPRRPSLQEMVVPVLTVRTKVRATRPGR
jgi:hypothetical protein